MGCESSHSVEVTSQEKRRSVKSDELGERQGSLDSEPGPIDVFTDIQIDCIRSTWPLVAKNRIKHGTHIFMDIFMIEPQVKQLFPFRDVNETALMIDHGFIRHVTRYMNCLELVCDNLEAIHDSDCAATRHLLVLGATHAHVNNFDFRFFHVFIKSTHFTWEQVLGEEYTQEVREAWTKLFDFVVTKIQEGFLVCMAEKEKELLNGGTNR